MWDRKESRRGCAVGGRRQGTYEGPGTTRKVLTRTPSSPALRITFRGRCTPTTGVSRRTGRGLGSSSGAPEDRETGVGSGGCTRSS